MASFSDMYKDDLADRERAIRVARAPELIGEVTEDRLREAVGRYLIAEDELVRLRADIRNVINAAYGGSVRTL